MTDASPGNKTLSFKLIVAVIFLTFWIGLLSIIILTAGCTEGASTVDRTQQACARTRILSGRHPSNPRYAVRYVALGATSVDMGNTERAREEFATSYRLGTCCVAGSHIVLTSGFEVNSALFKAIERAYHPQVSDEARKLFWEVIAERDPNLVDAMAEAIEAGDIQLTVDRRASYPGLYD
jgi:hypothetical protein